MELRIAIINIGEIEAGMTTPVNTQRADGCMTLLLFSCGVMLRPK